MYVIELQELRSVENQLVDALASMARLVEHPQLRHVLETHLDETKSQRDRLDRLLQGHGADKREYEDGSIRAIIREAERWANMVSDRDCRDAGIIASAQRIEHYEIAVYGTLATWARQLGLHDDERVLHDILEEEKQADEKLSRLAEGDVNREAAEHTQPSGSYVRGSAPPSTHYLNEANRVVRHQVEDNAILSLAVATAAGYLLAYLVHRTTQSRERDNIPDYARTRHYIPKREWPRR